MTLTQAPTEYSRCIPISYNERDGGTTVTKYLITPSNPEINRGWGIVMLLFGTMASERDRITDIDFI